MKIIDKLTGRLFDTPEKFIISIERSNPFLTTQGTVSLPIVFPYTDNNIQLLGYPARYDRAIKQVIKRKVIIQVNTYQREVSLQITQAQRPTPFTAGSITGTFLFDESEFYNRMKDIPLKTCFGVRRDMVVPELDAKIAQWVLYLDKVMSGQVIDNEFEVFTVCCEVDGTGVDLTCRNGFLNHVSNSLNYNTDGQSHYRLSGIIARQFVIDSNNVDIPLGYGITPFIKLKTVLHTLFWFYGYSLNEDYLVKYPDLQKAVLLNNVADTLMNGCVDLGQLVPSTTINEFLNFMRYKFACEFFTSETGTDIKIVFWNDFLVTTDLVLDKTIQNTPLVGFESQKTVQLTQNYTLRLGTPKFKNYNEMVKSFGNLPITYSAGFPDYSSHVVDFFEQIVFVQKKLRYYHLWTYTTEHGVMAFQFDELADDLFDYYAADNVTAMPFASPDEAVPMIEVDLGASKDLQPLWTTATRINPFLLPYVGPAINLNGSIVINNTTQSNSQTDNPIMLCYHFGRRVSDPAPNNGKIFWGTTHCYNDAGTPWGTINLTYHGPNGLFETFWKKFDQVLRNSWQPMIFPVNLSIYQALHWDPSKQKMLNGQPLVSEVLKYELSDDGITVTEADFRTTKLYLDS